MNLDGRFGEDEFAILVSVVGCMYTFEVAVIVGGDDCSG